MNHWNAICDTSYLLSNYVTLTAQPHQGESMELATQLLLAARKKEHLLHSTVHPYISVTCLFQTDEGKSNLRMENYLLDREHMSIL